MLKGLSYVYSPIVAEHQDEPPGSVGWCCSLSSWPLKVCWLLGSFGSDVGWGHHMMNRRCESFGDGPEESTFCLWTVFFPLCVINIAPINRTHQQKLCQIYIIWLWVKKKSTIGATVFGNMFPFTKVLFRYPGVLTLRRMKTSVRQICQVTTRLRCAPWLQELL